MSDKSFYRFGEILLALLSWGTIVILFLTSIWLPAFVAVFIVLFDLYWLFKTIVFSLYLSESFKTMKNNIKINWLKKLKNNPNTSNRWNKIWHLVIFPMYNEPFDVVKESFIKLSEINYPLNRMIVVLAIEERAGIDAKMTAKKIKDEFGNLFYKFAITIHPVGMPKEMPGKGSNQTWAIKEVKKNIIDKNNIKYENILVSAFDVDTQVYKDYFGILTYKFLTVDYPQHSSYQPVPLFLNNVYKAPALARIIGFSSTFWHLMQQSTPEKIITFSSHSMPFKALVEIGFWQKDIVSEDSRIFWQLFFHYNGNWRVEPLLYPVSMDANAAKSFWQTMINIYKQQRRWAWGTENVAYILSNFRKNNIIPKKIKLFWEFYVIEGLHSWATNSLIILSLGWLPVILGGDSFRTTLLAYNLPEITQYIMTFASLGIVTTAFMSMVILPPKPKWFKKIHLIWYLVSWILMPITLIVFGSFPALDAQTRLALSGKFRLDFWVTPKHRK